MLTTDRGAMGSYMQRSYLSGLTVDRGAMGSYMQRSYLSGLTVDRGAMGGLTVDRGAMGCVLLGANGGAKEEKAKEKKGIARALGKLKDWKVSYLDWRIAALQKKLDQLIQKRQALPVPVEMDVVSAAASDSTESALVDAGTASDPAISVQRKIAWYPGMPARI